MRKYGLLGRSLKHSFSPSWFADKFSRESIVDADYSIYEIEDISAFPDLLRSNPDLRGLNVTIPYKTKVCGWLDDIFGPAAALNVVNTIVIEKINEPFEGQKIEGFRTKGHNTDIYGFKESVKPLIKPYFERALILGTGATASTVAYVLYKLGIDVLFVSREPEGEQEIGWEDINEHVIRFHPFIINTTPVGMYPNSGDFPDIPYECLTDKHLLYDLIYNPAETEFLRKGKERGAQIQNGYSMLCLQAEQSWKTWQNAEVNR